MKIDAIVLGQRTRRVPAIARQVHAAGFDGLWFTEGGVPAYSGCTAAALEGLGLDVGTAIAVAFPRSPMVTAQLAWDLADLTGGRFVLGLGTQVRAHVERRYAAAFDHPGTRLREYVEAVRAIFRAFQGTERLAFEGRFWKLDLLPDAWSPGPIEHPDVPVYVSGVRPWMVRMAGEVADGLHVHPLHSTRYLTEVVLPAVAEGEARAGRPAGAVAMVCPVMAAVGDTEAEREAARDEARLRLAFYGSTRSYAGVFDVHGWEGTSERLHGLQRAGDLAGMAGVITDEMLDVYTVTAAWDDLAGALVSRYAGLADRLVVYGATSSWLADPSLLERWHDAVAAFHRAVEAQ